MIAQFGIGGAQTGDHQIAIAPHRVDRRNLVPGTDDPVETGLARQFGQAHDLIVRSATDPGRGHVVFVQAGEQGDANDLAVLPGRSLGVLHHRPATCGVDGDDRWLQHMDRLHRARDSVGDIVELQIEEDRQTQLVHFEHTVVAMGVEEFHPQLQSADMRCGLFSHFERGVEAREIEREIDRICVHCGGAKGS